MLAEQGRCLRTKGVAEGIVYQEKVTMTKLGHMRPGKKSWSNRG